MPPGNLAAMRLIQCIPRWAAGWLAGWEGWRVTARLLLTRGRGVNEGRDAGTRRGAQWRIPGQWRRPWLAGSLYLLQAVRPSLAALPPGLARSQQTTLQTSAHPPRALWHHKVIVTRLPTSRRCHGIHRELAPCSALIHSALITFRKSWRVMLQGLDCGGSNTFTESHEKWRVLKVKRRKSSHNFH